MMEQDAKERVTLYRDQNTASHEGETMPGTHSAQGARLPAPAEPASRTRYLVERREDVWFIVFGGEDFGPYKTDREAKLFAIDAAFKLGEQGEHTEVLVAGEAGAVAPVWLYGRHPYPPRD
jgi:hypothetical protein